MASVKRSGSNLLLGLTWAVLWSGPLLTGCVKEQERAPTPAQALPGEREKAEMELMDTTKDMAAPMKMAEEKAKKMGGKPGDKGRPETWKRSTLAANTSRLMIGDREELPVRGMQVHARLDGFRARVLIDFYFFNDRDGQYEGTFKLRLPDGASPYFLAFGQSTWTAKDGAALEKPRYDDIQVVRRQGFEPKQIVDQRAASWIEPRVARMVPKEKAARAYTETVRRRVDPALMEWSGSGVFSSRIFPIAPRKLHRVVVGYDMNLIRIGDDLEFELPLPADLPSCAVDLDVAAIEGARVQVTPQARPFKEGPRTHYRVDNPRDGLVKVRIANAGVAALAGRDPATGPYFAARVQPGLPAKAALGGARHAVFMVDVSMSSNPDGFNIWLALLRSILGNNSGKLKKFAVLFFNVESFWYQPGFTANTPENVEALMRFADGLALEGATDLGAALRRAARPDWLDAENPRRDIFLDIFLLGNGAVTWGEGDAFALSNVLGNGKNGALFAYRTGMAGSDTRMLQHLARESGGAVFSVVGESEVAAASTAHTRRPWEIRRVELSGASDLLLAGRPRFLFPGQRLLLAGRGEIKPGAVLVLKLRQGDADLVREIRLAGVVSSELAPRIYGQLAVSQLEDFAEAVGEQAGAYARHFRVTGKTTSLLMLESEEDYRRFDIVPQDDAGVIREKLATHLLAGALDALAQLLGDAKNAFLSMLKKLETAPGVRLRLDPALRKALEALPREAYELETPPLACKQHTPKGMDSGLLKQLERQKPEYDTVTTEALRRKRALGPADALKALSSLVEASPGDGVLARDVGFSAMEWGLHAHAFHLFRRVAVARPHEPQTYRALALSLAEQGLPNLALAWFEIGLGGSWDSRFGEFRKILLLDYLRFLQRVRAKGLRPPLQAWAQSRLGQLERELGMERADLLVSITWNTDNTDVDLHVLEPGGEECYYSNPSTRSGGRLTQDVTQGYGPEMYLLPKAPRGTYRVRAKYYSSDTNRASARTKVYATVFRNWGTPAEKVTRKVVTLEYGKEMHDIAKVEVP